MDHCRDVTPVGQVVTSSELGGGHSGGHRGTIGPSRYREPMTRLFSAALVAVLTVLAGAAGVARATGLDTVAEELRRTSSTSTPTPSAP